MSTATFASNDSTAVRSRPEDAAFYVTVSDPVQLSEGINKYTSYRVEVRGPNPNISNTSNNSLFPSSYASAVFRRYSDFAWLYDRLVKERGGAILPPLPEKQAVARFSPEFIEERRVLLERFLRRVIVHPELLDAPSLDVFLRADDITFSHAKNSKSGIPMKNNDPYLQQQQHQQYAYSSAYPSTAVSNMGGVDMALVSAVKKDGIKKWIAETKTTLFSSTELVKSPDDDLFEEIQQYVDSLERQMRNVFQTSSTLVKRGKEVSQALFEMGHAFSLLGQAEADDLGSVLTQMGQAADTLSTLSLQHSQLERSSFEEPLYDHLRTIQAINAALQRRHELRVTYTTALSEVMAKTSNLQRLRCTPGMDAKANGVESSLKRGQDYAELTRDEYATVSQRILREIDRFKRESADEIRHTVFQYINLQIEYNKTIEKVWSDLLPALEKVQSTYAGEVNNSTPSFNASSHKFKEHKEMEDEDLVLGRKPSGQFGLGNVMKLNAGAPGHGYGSSNHSTTIQYRD